jgi:hypothetical protein
LKRSLFTQSLLRGGLICHSVSSTFPFVFRRIGAAQEGIPKPGCPCDFQYTLYLMDIGANTVP